jgi:threonine synthase
MERLRGLFPEFGDLRSAVESYPVDDESIRSQIAKGYVRFGEIWCPHTATAFWVYDHLPAARKSARPWIVSATAHPAKFESIVEPLIGREVLVPESLRAILERPTHKTAIRPQLVELAAELDRWK